MSIITEKVRSLLVSMSENSTKEFDLHLDQVEEINYSFYGGYIFNYTLTSDNPHFMEAIIDKGLIFDRYEVLKLALVKSKPQIIDSLISKIFPKRIELLNEVLARDDKEMARKLLEYSTNTGKVDIFFNGEAVSVKIILKLNNDSQNNVTIESQKEAIQSSWSIYDILEYKDYVFYVSGFSFLALIICSYIHHQSILNHRFYDNRDANHATSISIMKSFLISYNEYMKVINGKDEILPLKFIKKSVKIIDSYSNFLNLMKEYSLPGVKKFSSELITLVNDFSSTLKKITTQDVARQFISDVKKMLNDYQTERNIKLIENGLAKGNTDILEKIFLMVDLSPYYHYIEPIINEDGKFWLYSKIDYFIFVDRTFIYSKGISLSCIGLISSLIGRLFQTNSDNNISDHIESADFVEEANILVGENNSSTSDFHGD